MWKQLRFIILLFVLCLFLAIYDKYSGAFFLPPGPPVVLGESTTQQPTLTPTPIPAY